MLLKHLQPTHHPSSPDRPWPLPTDLDDVLASWKTTRPYGQLAWNRWARGQFAWNRWARVGSLHGVAGLFWAICVESLGSCGQLAWKRCMASPDPCGKFLSRMVKACAHRYVRVLSQLQCTRKCLAVLQPLCAPPAPPLQKRKAKRTTNSDDEAAEDGAALNAANFRPNFADPRFADMMTNQHFALDPTDPRWARGSVGAGKLLRAKKTTDDASPSLNGSRCTRSGSAWSRFRALLQGQLCLAGAWPSAHMHFHGCMAHSPCSANSFGTHARPNTPCVREHPALANSITSA